MSYVVVGTNRVQCTVCNGLGRVIQLCNGLGRVIQYGGYNTSSPSGPCQNCNGYGYFNVFKPGDKIRALKNCSGTVVGGIYTVNSSGNSLIESSCSCTHDWELVREVQVVKKDSKFSFEGLSLKKLLLYSLLGLSAKVIHDKSKPEEEKSC
jgi:hypothetical protein